MVGNELLGFPGSKSLLRSHSKRNFISRKKRCLVGDTQVRDMIPRRVVEKDILTLSRAVACELRQIAEEAVRNRGIFTLAISGGSLPRALASALIQEEFACTIDWDKCHVFLADERFVPCDHLDSNLKLIKEELFSKLPSCHIHAVNTTVDLCESARQYQEDLICVLGKSDDSFPSFDAILLGVGPDGHICSLFPNHALLSERVRCVAEIRDSPKPPAERVTLTLPIINEARNILFVITGSNKADVVQEIFKGNRTPTFCPAKLVRGRKVSWFLDAEAASKI